MQVAVKIFASASGTSTTGFSQIWQESIIVSLVKFT
jgi:hypothetical protein